MSQATHFQRLDFFINYVKRENSLTAAAVRDGEICNVPYMTKKKEVTTGSVRDTLLSVLYGLPEYRKHEDLSMLDELVKNCFCVFSDRAIIQIYVGKEKLCVHIPLKEHTYVLGFTMARTLSRSHIKNVAKKILRVYLRNSEHTKRKVRQPCEFATKVSGYQLEVELTSFGDL